MLIATRGLLVFVLTVTLALPAAAEPQAPASDSAATPASKLTPDSEPGAASPQASVTAPALDAPAREPEPFIRGHRYAYIASGGLLLAGVGFGYFSRGEAKRAQSLESAREAQTALERSRTAAATANVMYGVAGLTLAYGLLLELLPEPAADAASLTYHF
ncbi:MAG TPA: hypothetical protein VF815_04365 [Myxococcaceae bacterium]|jgi:hypothetical protein